MKMTINDFKVLQKKPLFFSAKDLLDTLTEVHRHLGYRFLEAPVIFSQRESKIKRGEAPVEQESFDTYRRREEETRSFLEEFFQVTKE